MLLEPDLEGEIVSKSPEIDHGSMRVRVHQSRKGNLAVTAEGLQCAKGPRQLIRRTGQQ